MTATGLDLAEWFGGEPGPSHDGVFEILSGHRQSDTVKVVRWEAEDELKARLPQLLAEQLGFDEDADEELEFSESLGGQVAGAYAYFQRAQVRCRRGRLADTQPLPAKALRGSGSQTASSTSATRLGRLKSLPSSPKGQPRRFLKPQTDQLIVYGDKVINNRNTRVPKGKTWPEEERFLANGEIGIVVGQIRTRKFNYPPRKPRGRILGRRQDPS